MKELIESVYDSITNQNWYSALITSLILPDICGKLQYPNRNSQSRYVEWYNSYLATKYNGFLSAEDCYALRCSYIHEGTDDISNQRARDVLNYFLFTINGWHCNRINLNSTGTAYLQLNVKTFCLDICSAAEQWLLDVSQDSGIQDRISKMIKIHEGGTLVFKG